MTIEVGSKWRRKRTRVKKSVHVVTAVTSVSVTLDGGSMMVNREWFLEHWIKVS